MNQDPPTSVNAEQADENPQPAPRGIDPRLAFALCGLGGSVGGDSHRRLAPGGHSVRRSDPAFHRPADVLIARTALPTFS